MTRQRWVAAGVVGALVLIVVLLWTGNRRAALASALPEWTKAYQPPDGVANEVNTLTAAQSWASARCTPLTACCEGRTAGMRTRRTYPDTLATSADSFIGFHLNADGRL